MTAERRDGNEDAFCKWVRGNRERLHSVKHGLSLTDSDLWFHKYKQCGDRVGERTVQHIMLVEYKQFGADLTFAQADTLGAVDQLLRNTRGGKRQAVEGVPRIAKVRSKRGFDVTIKAWGVHYLRLNGADPPSSEWMLWDGKLINQYTLEGLLRFDLNPDTLEPLRDRRHHTKTDPS